MILVVSTYCLRPTKKISSVARLPNEKRNSKATNSYHPSQNIIRESVSIDQNAYRYSQQHPPPHPFNKYAVPISPQMEKIQLPESYDANSLLNTHSNPRPLSRHHAPKVPGNWVEYTPPPAATSYYYSQQESHQENSWYPSAPHA